MGSASTLSDEAFRAQLWVSTALGELLAGAPGLSAAPTRARLAATQLRGQDFEPFLADARATEDDFVFVDPPYDSEFSDYDNRPFTLLDQRRLRDALEILPARVMLVIKDTPGIRALYSSRRWHVIEAAKTYSWTIKSRNNRAATHLTITSYVPEATPIAGEAAVPPIGDAAQSAP